MTKVLLLVGLCCLFASVVHAGVPVIITEGDIRLDVARFPSHLREQVELVNTKCTKCHSLTRIVQAIDTGRTDSGALFDKNYVRSMIIKKKRNPAANFTAEEVKAIMQLLDYMQGNPTQYMEK